MTDTIRIAYASGNEVHVHAAGCVDLTKSATKSAAYNGIHTAAFPAGTDERAVWVDYNIDFLEEDGVDGAWPLRFMPCATAAGITPNADRTWN